MTVLLAVVAGWLASLGLGTATALADNPPVMAESFESVTVLPAGWKFVEYAEGDSTATTVNGAAADGMHFLRIVSSKPNHARVMAPVQVTPNTSYRFRKHSAPLYGGSPGRRDVAVGDVGVSVPP